MDNEVAVQLYGVIMLDIQLCVRMMGTGIVVSLALGGGISAKWLPDGKASESQVRTRSMPYFESHGVASLGHESSSPRNG